MCFSPEADLLAGAVIAPLGVLTLRQARDEPRAWPLAALPLLLGAHQLVESLVWLGADGSVPESVARHAAQAYAWIALPLLPLFLPVAVALVARPGRARWCWPFVGLGVVVAAVMGSAIADGMSTSVHDRAIVYHVGLDRPALWTVLYVVAVMGGPLLSGHRWLVALGVVNVVGLSAVALFYTQAFASYWCLWAAVTSLIVVVHVLRRRAELDAQAPSIAPTRDGAKPGNTAAVEAGVRDATTSHSTER